LRLVRLANMSLLLKAQNGILLQSVKLVCQPNFFLTKFLDSLRVRSYIFSTGIRVWRELLKFDVIMIGGGIAESVWQLTMGWRVRGSNPVGGEISFIPSDRPWGPPGLLHNGYRVIPWGKATPTCR
jgi:hypothetical protein